MGRDGRSAPSVLWIRYPFDFAPHGCRSAKGLEDGRVMLSHWILPHTFPDGLESHPCRRLGIFGSYFSASFPRVWEMDEEGKPVRKVRGGSHDPPSWLALPPRFSSPSIARSEGCPSSQRGRHRGHFRVLPFPERSAGMARLHRPSHA